LTVAVSDGVGAAPGGVVDAVALALGTDVVDDAYGLAVNVGAVEDACAEVADGVADVLVCCGTLLVLGADECGTLVRVAVVDPGAGWLGVTVKRVLAC